MDMFDKFLFDEITQDYNKDNLSSEEYEEIYQRFLNLEHVPEVKPYLLAMRFLGLGTEAEQEEVLSVLRSQLSAANLNLCGLYYDLLLYKDRSNSEAAEKLAEYESNGYTDSFLKEYSHLNYEVENENEEEYNDDDYEDEYDETENDDDTFIFVSDDYGHDQILTIKSVDFLCGSSSGYYFTTKDINYLHARVHFDPIQKPCHIRVHSLIYDNYDLPFSNRFVDEIDLKPGDTWFTTNGWGSTTCDCYSEGIYKWVIVINEKQKGKNKYQKYSQSFQMYYGMIDKTGPILNNVKLFSSKATGAQSADLEHYSNNFDSRTLEYVYFKMFIEPMGIDIYAKFILRIIYLEDNSVFYDNYSLMKIESYYTECWNGIGYGTPGYWKKGLYKYTVKISNSRSFEGTFTVY